MHRTHTAGLLAMALPWALALHWAAVLPLVVGLWLTRTWTAWLAAMAGAAWLMPWTLAISASVALVTTVLAWGTWTQNRIEGRSKGSLADQWFPYGASLDGLRARFISWAYLVKTFSWRGGDTRAALEAAHLRSGGVAMEGSPARNEFLDLAYTYGWRGVVILVSFAAFSTWWLRPGDPWAATMVAAIVVCSGTSPLRAFRRWLTGGDGPLFGPPLRASLTIHIDANDAVHLYGAPTKDRGLDLAIARAFFSLGSAWVTQRGLSLAEVAG